MPKVERHGTQLYLIAHVRVSPADLAAAIDAGQATCVLLRADADPDDLRTAIVALRPVAQQREAAFLLEGRPDLAAATGCDGVHLAGDGKAAQAARNVLGEDAIVGVGCGGSRHIAMLAGEAGADYVAFGAGPAAEAPEDAAEPELLSVWQADMTVPCVALGGVSLKNAASLAEAGADFVAAGEAVWRHPDGPAAGARAIAEQLLET
jgi:thiamine-phosphate pyrophosphorylase